MAGFKALDKRLSRDEKVLHDVLWHASKAEPGKLRADIQKDMKDLDAFLRVGGRLRRAAFALDNAWGDPGAGESLFELLGHTYYLTAATERLRKKDYKGAGEHVATAVESVSIGVCANAGCFEIVQEWEGGKTDFEEYAGKLADFLQEKGVSRAGEFKRHLIAARDFGRSFDETATKAEQALGARAAIANGLWVNLASIPIRKSLGSPPRFPYDDYAVVLERIASRV
ncbi:MAG TPA: hypothetical protein VJ224_06935 [Thermoplasmata archaeon]|nr:hypothetical protein [Thermoplasmata archaeon]HLA46649.1 hypothetical protein [Thermoplasmata archaeon]